MSDDDRMGYFLDLYAHLPRCGPGDDAHTLRALERVGSLPLHARILDIGCGPGAQTSALAQATDARLIAVDNLAIMLERLRHRAGDEGWSDRVSPVLADMGDLPFVGAAFDLIWSEGALYNIGFRHGLASLKSYLKPGGYAVVSEVVWLRNDPPEVLKSFWTAYPEIDSVEHKWQIIHQVGYDAVADFVLPAAVWESSYYGPLRRRLAQVEARWMGNVSAEDVLNEARLELSMFDQFSDFYSYAYFVMRLR